MQRQSARRLRLLLSYRGELFAVSHPWKYSGNAGFDPQVASFSFKLGPFSLFISTKEALTGAEGRREALEADLAKLRLRMADEKQKAVQEKQEEINRVNEELKKHQERLHAEAVAKEEACRFVLCNLGMK